MQGSCASRSATPRDSLTCRPSSPLCAGVDAADSSRPRLLPTRRSPTAPLWQPPDGTRAPSRRRPPRRRAPRRTSTAPRRRSATRPQRQQIDRGAGGRGLRPESEPSAAGRDRPAGDDDRDDETYGGARTRATGNLPAVVAPHLIAFCAGDGADVAQLHFNAPLQGDAARRAPAWPPRSKPSRCCRSTTAGWRASAIGRVASDRDRQRRHRPARQRHADLSASRETRWGFDLRYAIPLGERFLLLPRFGYGHVGYDLERRGQPAPSLCATTSTQVCLPDVQLSHLTLGLDARLALAPSVGLSLAAGLPAGVRARARRGAARRRVRRQRAGDVAARWPRAGSCSIGWRCARRCRSPTTATPSAAARSRTRRRRRPTTA